MITSSQNPKIQMVRALLAQSRQRQKSGTFVIEGVRLAEEALTSGWQPLQGFYSANLSPRGMQTLDGFRQKGAIVEEITQHLMQSLSDTDSPQGILVTFELRSLPIPAQLDFILILDELHDPGNLGTLLRSAVAANTQLVLLTPGGCDPFSPKVLRAGMGAQFRLPIITKSWADITTLLRTDTIPAPSVFLADARDGAPFWSQNLRQPLALIIGSETAGASSPAHQLAGQKITIPMPGKSESLNAAMAGGILLFEVVRQRNTDVL